mgnify:CR=1 FL=1
MKRTLPVLLALLCTVALSQDLLRIVNGTEELASIPPGLPTSVTNAYAQQLAAAGYRPVETVNAPHSDWCTRPVRTVNLTNDVYRVEWIECPVPMPLDRARLCSTILGLPDGTNLLAAAMSVPAVAEWFVADPVYVRGSDLALGMQQLLGLDQVALETLIQPCKAQD